MSRALRILIAVAALLGGVASLFAAATTALTRGTAITDPDLLRKLDQNDTLTISRLLSPERNADVPLTTDLMFASLPQLKEIPPAIDAEFDRHVHRGDALLAHDSVGIERVAGLEPADRPSQRRVEIVPPPRAHPLASARGRSGRG